MTLKYILSIDEKPTKQRKAMWRLNHLKSGTCPNQLHYGISSFGVHCENIQLIKEKELNLMYLNLIIKDQIITILSVITEKKT